MADGVTQAQFEALENKVDAVSARMDAGFAGVDAAFADQRPYTDHAFEQLRTEMHEQFAGVDGRLARLERKLDQFIDTQSRANQLTERRLRRLESRA